MKRLAAILACLAAALVALLGLFVVFAWAPDRPVSELVGRWAQPPSIFVDVAGMKVHMRDEGPREDARPIVLLHGTSASLHTWEGWSRALTSRRRVIRLDLPGFGLTGPAPDNAYTIESYVRFMKAVLDKLGVQRCVLGGNSFGGYVAWATALADPGRIEKLILVDAGGYPQQSASVPIGFRLARLPVASELFRYTLPRSIVESSVRNVYGHPGKVTPELVDLYYAITLREGNRQALVQRFAQAQPGALAERIAELRLPTLIIWGGRDRLIPLENAQRFRRDLADSRLVVFDDLGHVPHEEDPGRTVAAVLQFLDRD
jgi:pimeloyl-ACP methyl ester carboxylesterase